MVGGYHLEMIIAGRRINDGMGRYITLELVLLTSSCRLQVNGASILVMGVTFKEKCPAIRNTPVVDIARELMTTDVAVDIYDPWADA